MRRSPEEIRKLLLSTIQNMASSLANFVKKSEKDFTRNHIVMKGSA